MRDLTGWMEQAHLPAHATLAERGHFVPLGPVEPTFTTTGLVSLLTGQPPAAHGHLGVGDPPPVEPFWTDPCCDSVLIGDWPGGGARIADWGIIPGERLVDSALHEPSLAPAAAWENAPPSFSSRLEATLPLMRDGRQIGELYLLVIDTTNDGTTAYDEYWIAMERRIGPEAVRLDNEDTEWTTLTWDGSAALSLRLVNGEARSLRIYQSPARRTVAWPGPVEQMLDRTLGYYPPAPDLFAYEQGWLAEDGLRDMAQQQTAWLADVTARLWQESAGERPRVVVARWPAPGLVQRALLLAEPAQPGWDRDRQLRLLKTRRRAAEAADALLAQLLSHVDLSRHTVFVTSPLGMAPVHSEIHLPTLLRMGGLDPDQFLVRAEGEAAWIRPAPSAPAEWGQDLHQLLEEAGVPDQQPLFESIVPGRKIGGGAGAGWLFLRAAPGHRISDRPDEQVVAPATLLGDVGGAPHRPELAGWWITAGHAAIDTGEAERMPLPDVPAAAAQLLTTLPTPEPAQE